MSEKRYVLYIILGLFYFVSKLVYFILGLVCTKAIIYGIVASTLTTCFGFLAVKEYREERMNKALGHWAAVLTSLLLIPLTIIVMVNELGLEPWPLNRIIIFIIWEGLAIAQFLLTIIMFRNLKILQGQGVTINEHKD